MNTPPMFTERAGTALAVLRADVLRCNHHKRSENGEETTVSKEASA